MADIRKDEGIVQTTNRAAIWLPAGRQARAAKAVDSKSIT